MSDVATSRPPIVTDKPKIKNYPVTEMFGPTIQGEGLMTGTITHFIRFGGCSLRCAWCDSLHSVLPEQIKKFAQYKSIDDIIQMTAELGHAPFVTLTGGDPCIHQGLGPLIDLINMNGMQVAVETQGMLFPDWLDKCDVVTFSPKGPGSGKTQDIQPLIDWFTERYNNGGVIPRICIKIVVADFEEDLEFALDVYNRIPEHFYEQFWLNAPSAIYEDNELSYPSAGVIRRLELLDTYQALVAHIMDNKLKFNSKVRVGCQQHVLLWPTKNVGV